MRTTFQGHVHILFSQKSTPRIKEPALLVLLSTSTFLCLSSQVHFQSMPLQKLRGAQINEPRNRHRATLALVAGAYKKKGCKYTARKSLNCFDRFLNPLKAKRQKNVTDRLRKIFLWQIRLGWQSKQSNRAVLKQSALHTRHLWIQLHGSRATHPSIQT